MHNPVADERRALIDLFPQFLGSALRGWQGLNSLLASAGLERPTYFLLRALVQERDAGDSMALKKMQADLFNPYSTVRPILGTLPALVSAGYVAHVGDRYTVTESGHERCVRIEHAKTKYLSALMPIPTADLVQLAEELTAIAHRLRDAPEPAQKPHQARAWRVMPPVDAAPMARLYGAVYALWMARDDSHNAAWRTAGFDGPTFDLLSRVWSGETSTLPALMEATQDSQRPEDVERGSAALVTAGYLTRAGNRLALTPHGAEIRGEIETETDRIYFAPWPPLTIDAIGWLRTTLVATIEGVR